ncbi:LysR family transcriptional regulator [Roseovarius sp. SCSIO 43702]|uniref:LysR substrate-binding domain-containing protein n=1 Tax=Roseovarius sp. SCSIO 43702 TaxID=2823043 RepID=UPI001C739D72|nr:LysR substrate-binding domain-containing protein [Roseovarius sp. SCSIO 43702]QYX56387.1 LysR family transcriptional regulator [Roseovarius sp. SCSIO 43702]
MNWLDLPPLTALRAFAAFAETGSVVDAGAALNVSHAAVSQQLRALEAHMGATLLDRSGRAMKLTVEGQQLAEALRTGFGAIAHSVETITGADAARPLHITTTPLFASAWLMPQMSAFHAAHPGTNLILSTSPEIQALEPGGIDVAIRYGSGVWPGLESECLFTSPMVLVGAPSLVGDEPVRDMSALSRFPVLQDGGLSEVNRWLKDAGVLDGRDSTSIQLPGNLLLDAVRDGQGVAVVIRTFVEQDLKANRLRLLYTHDTGKGYHVVTRPGVLRPVARVFVKWLRTQLRLSDPLTKS